MTFPRICSAASIVALLGIAAAMLLLALPSASAQTIDDGIMMRRANLFTGTLYTYDYWNNYWEGHLKRDNGNIGTITTRSTTWFANYGVTDRLNVLVSLPYIWTRASQGVLHGQSGIQDISLSVKCNFLERHIGDRANLRAIAVVTGGLPLSNYTPDFLPLSIGSASKRIGGRFTSFYHHDRGWFLNGTTSYTWRASIHLDRPYYFTDGQLFLTDEVALPNVFDYSVGGGYLKHRIMIPFTFTQQRMQSGGDIRRQDMPFVSNRMNFSKVGVFAMTPIPFLKNNPLRVRFGYDRIIDGRNVGQSNTFTAGMMYTFNFSGVPNQ